MKIFVEAHGSEAEFEHIEKARELKSLRVNLISLVKSPANRKPVVLKSDGSWELNGRIVSKSADKRFVYATVYEPDTVDSQGDWATPETIQKAAYDFVGNGRMQMVDYEHDYNPNKGTVVESWILRGEDPNFVGVKKGSWCVVIELSPAGQAIADTIDGVSLAGTAAAKSASSESSAPNTVSQTPLLRPVAKKTPLLRISNSNRK